MAAYTAARSISKTLAGTTVDTCTINSPCQYVEVTNRGGTATVWFTVDGTTPTAAGDNVEFLQPGMWLQVSAGAADTNVVVKVLGNGNDYTVRRIA